LPRVTTLSLSPLPVGFWRYAGQSVEHGREMALILKTDGEADLRERQVIFSQQPLGSFDAAIENVTVRWAARRLFERTTKVMRIHSHNSSQLRQRQIFSKILIDILDNSLQLASW